MLIRDQITLPDQLLTKMRIRFFASGMPKGQPRPRAFAFGGKARVFDPGTAEGWKSRIAEAARPFRPTKPLTGPLYVHLEFFFARPKSHFLREQIRQTAPGYHTSKPDSDNCAKAVLDALTTLRMWTDDALVADLRVRKLYPNIDGHTGCLITIEQA